MSTKMMNMLLTLLFACLAFLGLPEWRMPFNIRVQLMLFPRTLVELRKSVVEKSSIQEQAVQDGEHTMSRCGCGM
jgi:hypothetical protein